uniref:Uncharacterized protein n=1 Tax=Anguilla anguilla TaxID=7936 RepID=A0A0E9QLJ9_ANGAN
MEVYGQCTFSEDSVSQSMLEIHF